MKIAVIFPYTVSCIHLGSRIAEMANAIGIKIRILIAVPDVLSKAIIDEKHQNLILQNSYIYIKKESEILFLYTLENQSGKGYALDSSDTVSITSGTTHLYLPVEYKENWDWTILSKNQTIPADAEIIYYPSGSSPHEQASFFLQTFSTRYPDHRKNADINALLNHFDELIGSTIHFTGRVISCRKMKLTLYADCLQYNRAIQISFETGAFEQLPIPGDVIAIEGISYRTLRKEPTIKVSAFTHKAHWAQEESYTSVMKNSEAQHNRFFQPGFYKEAAIQTIVSQVCREFLEQHEFREIFTQAVLSRYNGGNSYPTEVHFKSNRIGFFRTTLEEQMKGYIAAGFKNIYQAGPVMRGGNEFTLLEGYSQEYNWQSGTAFALDLLQKVIDILSCTLQKEITGTPARIDFFTAFEKAFGHDKMYLLNSETLPDWLNENKITNKPGMSVETAIDQLAKYLCREHASFCILEGYPALSSPLYKKWHDAKYDMLRLERSKICLDANFLMDLGMEETDINNLSLNLQEQRERLLKLGRDVPDDSAIESIIQGGVPACFGFGLSFSRLSKLFSA